MFLKFFLPILAFAAFARAADSEFSGTDVVFIIDGADLSETDRTNVMAFTKDLTTDATTKGANVGLVFGNAVYIMDGKEFKQTPLEKRLMKLSRYNGEINNMWKTRDQSELTTSTLAESLTELENRLHYVTNPQKIVAVLVTGANNLPLTELGTNLLKLARFNIHYTAVVLGSSINPEDFADITESPCLVTQIDSSDKFGDKEKARLTVLLRRLSVGIPDLEDKEALCSEISAETDEELSRMKPRKVVEKEKPTEQVVPIRPALGTTTPKVVVETTQPPVQTTQEQTETIRNENIVKELRTAEREAIEGLQSDRVKEESKRDEDSEIEKRRRNQEEEVEKIRKLAEQERLKQIEEEEKMHPIRAEKVEEDKKMVEQNKITEEKITVPVPPAVVETTTPEQTTPEPTTPEPTTTTPEPTTLEPTTTTTTTTPEPTTPEPTTPSKPIEQLICYRCDGCGEEEPDSSSVVSCGEVGKSSCYTARIGFANDITYVRGCEIRARCVDVNSPVLNRKCCSTSFCNGAVASDRTKKPEKKKSPPKTTPTPPPTTTMETIPSVEVAKSRVRKHEIDTTLPFTNLDVYFVVDFAGLSTSQGSALVNLAKRLAVETAALGAEVGIANGNRIRRISPYQIHIAFESSRKRPAKEDILRRFDSELNLTPPTEAQSGSRVRHIHMTTAEPSAISNIPVTMEHLAEKLLLNQDRSDADARRYLFIVFLTGGELPSMTPMHLWETHEQIATLSPHYMALLVGDKPSSDVFLELAENSDNPRCLVMRFKTLDQLVLPETEVELAKMLVESVDYVRAHETLSTFRCGNEPALPVVRKIERVEPEETSTTPTEPTTVEAVTTEQTTERTTEPTQPHLHPVIVVPKETERANVIVVEPEEAPKMKDTEMMEDNEMAKPAEDNKPIQTVVEVDVVDRNGEPLEKIVVVPKPTEAEEPKLNQEKPLEIIVPNKQEEVAQPRVEEPERRVVVVIEEDVDKQLTHQQPNPEEKQPLTVEERVEKIVAKIEEMPVRVDNKETPKKKEELTVVIVEPKEPKKPTETKKLSEENRKKVGKELTTTPKAVAVEPPAPRGKAVGKPRNGTRKDGGKLMCYQCEGCSAGRPPQSSIVTCGNGDVSSPGRGVCFIQRVGDKYTRGCIEGYECLETKSAVLTNFCCNSHSLCNDVLPSPSVIGSASSATLAKGFSITVAMSLFFVLLM